MTDPYRNLDLDALEFTDEPAEAPTPAADEDDAMVVRTYRLPLALDEKLKTLAAQRDIKVATLIRDLVMREIAAAEGDHAVRLSDVQAAVASVLARLPHAS